MTALGALKFGIKVPDCNIIYLKRKHTWSLKIQRAKTRTHVSEPRKSLESPASSTLCFLSLRYFYFPVNAALLHAITNLSITGLNCILYLYSVAL